jgi:hypothetical protein
VVSRPEARDMLTVRVAGVPTEKEKAVQGALPTAVQAACRVQLDELLFVPEIGANERGMVDERVWG